MDDLEDFIVIDKRIDVSEDQAADAVRAGLRERWEFGRLMLTHRKGKQLPKGMLAELVAATGKSQAELGYRMRFAERYPTEDKVCRALQTLTSWTQVKNSLPAPAVESAAAQKKPRINPPKPHKQRDEMVELASEGLSTDQVSKEIGVPRDTVRRELERDAIATSTRAETLAEVDELQPIDWDTLPGNAAAKLDVLQRRLTRQMEREFNAKVQEATIREADRYLAGWLDNANQTWNELTQLRKAHKGALTKDEYNLIRACLHPDSRLSMPDTKLAKAFQVFNDAEVVLIDTRNEAPRTKPLPSSLRDLKRKTRNN